MFTGEIHPGACDVAARRYLVPMKLIAHGARGGGDYDVYIDGSGEDWQLKMPWEWKIKHAAVVRC